MASDRALALAAQWNTEAALITGGETVAAGHRHSQSDIDDLLLALQSRLSTAQLGQPLGAAPLDANAKVPVFYLPDISTTRGVFPVSSQAAMLALNAQVGAVAVRSDLNGQSYILAALPASNLSNWLSQSPPGTVTSVNGQTGAVTIPLPSVATTTTDGLMPAGDRLILSGQGATDTQVLRRVGGVIVWANPEIWTVRTGNATLGVNEACAANSGVTELTLPATASGGHEILNNTTATITVVRGGTTTISGIARSTGAAIAATDRVRILPGQRGLFVASGGNWVAQGCEQNALVFTYNGNPLSNNPANALNAGGIFHYLGILAGGGTWANPAGTSLVVAAISSLNSGSAGVDSMTNRVASGENVISSNVPGSWMGWYFPGQQLRIGSFIFQTRSLSNNHPRNFQIRVGTLSSLSSGTNVTSIPVAQSWADQVTVSNTYYGPYTITTPLIGNAVIWQSTGVDSGGSSYHGAQEIELFGDYLL